MNKIPYNPKAARISDITCMKYDGIFVGLGYQFTDIEQTGSTLIANTIEEAKAKLSNMRALFAMAGFLTEIKDETKVLLGAIDNLHRLAEVE